MKTRLACLAIAAAAGTAVAQVTPIGPFAGQLQESFESFQNYIDNPNFHEDTNGPFPIFGGNATMVGPFTAIYEPGVADFGLGSNGFAQVVDGRKGAGLDNSGTWTIQFGTPVVDFGGYWSHYPDPGNPITFDFYDAGGNLLGSDSATVIDGSGSLHWLGWNSVTPVSTVVVGGDYMVVDYMQANVPAPGALALLGLGGLAAVRRRR